MEEIFIDRLQAFFDYEGLNDNQITVSAGLSVGLINRTRKDRSGMNSGNLTKILNAYPQLSADWLLTGKGHMIKSEYEQQPHHEEKSAEEFTINDEMDKSSMLIQMVEYYGQGKKNHFANRLGVRPQTINTWLSRNTFDTELIYSKCEDISADWLLTGQGNMLKSDEATPHQYDGTGEMLVSDLPEQYNTVSQDNMVDKLIGIIDMKADIIRQQAEDIGHLRSELEQLKKNFKQVLAPAQILTNEG